MPIKILHLSFSSRVECEEVKLSFISMIRFSDAIDAYEFREIKKKRLNVNNEQYSC